LGKIEIESIEAANAFLEKTSKPLPIAFPSYMSDENFDKTLERYSAEVKDYRSKHKPITLQAVSLPISLVLPSVPIRFAVRESLQPLSQVRPFSRPSFPVWQDTHAVP
jgi:hypothetical protein